MRGSMMRWLCVSIAAAQQHLDPKLFDAAARLADEFASQRASPLWAGVERGRRKRLVDAARAVEAADDEQNRRRRRDNDRQSATMPQFFAMTSASSLR